MTIEERLTLIEDRQQIHDLILKYARGVDGDRALFTSVWAEDAVYRVDEPFGEVRGIDAIAATWDGYARVLPTMYHFAANILIDGPHGDEATASSLSFVTGADAEGTSWIASSTYHDSFRKIDGRWLFTERYDKVNYMIPVPDLAALGLDEASRVYVTPEVIERLAAAEPAN